jgi:hypothetical protein
MTDRYAQTLEAIKDAEPRGWEITSRNTVRRMREHTTPADVIEYGWWTGPTYQSIEWLDFVWHSRDRVPIVLYTTSRTYWTPREKDGQHVSFKRALEILKSETADVHENHYGDDHHE